MQVSDLVYIDSTGYHFADYPTFQSWLQDQYRAIYGADVILDADSQDGQFLAVLAQALYDTASLGASVYNSFSPVTSQGTGLSRLVKINGLNRRVPSHSTVDITIIGQSGTSIVNGVVQDTLQQKWDVPDTLIPISGTITVTAVAQEEGAISAEASTVTTIFTPTLGWQSVNNVAAATPGAAVETDAELRLRQSQSTANPSHTVVEGTTGAIANLTGVQKVTTYENDTGSIDSNGIPAHSISSVVVGGDDVEICESIALHKTPGAGTFGDTTEIVYDTHGMPLSISFERAVTASIQVEITISADVGWSSDFVPLIQAAVAAQLNGYPIGALILLTKLYAPAYLFGVAQGLTYSITTLEIGKNGAPVAGSNITLAWDENPVCIADTDVTVIVT